jgi:hypothetical protein
MRMSRTIWRRIWLRGIFSERSFEGIAQHWLEGMAGRAGKGEIFRETPFEWEG